MAFFSRPSSNSAVKIVQPDEKPESPKPQLQLRKDSTQRQCRNILIYGSCKFQDKGCIYYHPPSQDGALPETRAESPSTGSLPAQAVNAPVFVPKSVMSPQIPTSAKSDESVFTPPSPSPPSTADFSERDPYDPYAYSVTDESMDGLASAMSHLDTSGYDDGEGGHHMLLPPEYDTLNLMDSFYPPQPTFIRQPLNYHLYTLPLPSSFSHTYFIPDSIRAELQQRAEIVCTAPAPGLNLPEEFQGYHTLVPLEPVVGERRKFGNWYSTVYRATSEKDGGAYVLRRIENFRLMRQEAFQAIEVWSKLEHPNIVSIKEAFTTRAFTDNSLVVVYDYHPNAQTLFDAHIKPKGPTFVNGRLQQHPQHIPESTLWSYIVQIANAIKAVHDQGLAVRMIDPTKILVTGKNRVRIGSCGIIDVLAYDLRSELVPELKHQDLQMFGRLIVTLCCGNLAAFNNVPKAIDTVGRQYSGDVKNVAMYLLSNRGPHKTIEQLFNMLGSRLLTEMDETSKAVDRLEAELMSELENARLVRLMCKMGFINERPEFAREPRWSETGDRYIVKLFRDYVFHQVDENGNPVVNMSHVLTCLNKLDAGTEERIMLVSRDEQSCLVVSYKEVKACIDAAFSDLARGGMTM